VTPNRNWKRAPGQNVANVQNIHNLGAEFGPSMYDVKLINVTSVVYQLPFGKGQRFMGNSTAFLMP